MSFDTFLALHHIIYYNITYHCLLAQVSLDKQQSIQGYMAI